MDDNGTAKSAVRTTLGKMGLHVISQCLICRKFVLDDSNMKQHIDKHTAEERVCHKMKKNMTQHIISNFMTQKAIPKTESWNVAYKRAGFLQQVTYHLDKCFVPFAAVENTSYKKMHGGKNGYYKDGDKFSKAILNLKSESQESIKTVLQDTSMVSLMIDGWSDDSYRKYSGVIVCSVPNLAKLNDIPYQDIFNLTKNNEGELQCKIYLSLMPIEDESELAVNLVEWVLEILDLYEISDKIFAIMSDKAAANVKIVLLLYQRLKKETALVKQIGEVFYLNCTAHLENRLITKISKGLKSLEKDWQKRIIKLVGLIHRDATLKYRWKKFFGFLLPSQNEIRWFSEFKVYNFFFFLRSAPRLSKFL